VTSSFLSHFTGGAQINVIGRRQMAGVSVCPTVSSGTGYTAFGVEESLYIVNGFYRMTDGKSNEDGGD